MIEKKLKHIQYFQQACKKAVENTEKDVQRELGEAYYQDLPKALALTQSAQKDILEEYKRFFENVSEILALSDNQ